MFSANASQVSNDVKYIEDFCSVYLRTGTGASQTVTTGVKENTGALVISKSRSAATDWAWYDTFRGATYDLVSNSTAAQTTQSQGLTTFNADGHTWGTLAKINTSGATYVDTVLKPTPKFFDVVTWTGNGTPRIISHSLGAVPGCIIVKRTDAADIWAVWHRSLPNATTSIPDGLVLNATDATGAFDSWFNGTQITSTGFGIKDNSGINASGGKYVAYLFAHNAGGFGLTGTDNVISCGSYTGNGSTNGPVVTLGYEPQWIMVKNAGNTGDWVISDVMRGLNVTDTQNLIANGSASETTANIGHYVEPTSTGFKLVSSSASSNQNNTKYIYIAIRRGPMKVPTSGTSVFSPVARTGTGTSTAVTTPNFPPDMLLQARRGAPDWPLADRLRGASQNLATCYTSAESTPSPAYVESFDMTGATLGSGNAVNGSGLTYIEYFFRRAPSFFDEVCYTGNDTSNRVLNHNLGTAPEMMIFKRRGPVGVSTSWLVYHAGMSAPNDDYIILNSDGAKSSISGTWGTPTATTFTLGIPFTEVNGASPQTYVGYLFATCAGVSKCTAFTGTGTLQTINCGFTAGSRFVLIKRTDAAGDWYVWDSSRGLSSSTDPYLLLNSTAAEVTSTNWVDTTATGFQVTAASGNNVNINGASYIALAIA